MSRIHFVTRADDLGSSNSANQAIQQVVDAGFIKNVSVMAPGPNVEQAAAQLANRKDICFGMHTTLNAEWDRVKWGPVLPLKESSGLVDKDGYFLPDPSLFATTKPRVELIMQEVAAQLERLHTLGFNIQYIDSHMFPEMFVEGLDEAMADFARQKGLIDHMYYYAMPPNFAQMQLSVAGVTNYLRTLPNGQYFFVTHPSLYTQEMLQTGNAQHSGENVAKGRAKETEIFSGKALLAALALLSVKGIGYNHAVPLPQRLSVKDLQAILMQP